MSVRDTEEYKNMSFGRMMHLTYNDPENDEEALACWQMLVDTGVVWELEGWYGRTALEMIENGIIER